MRTFRRSPKTYDFEGEDGEAEDTVVLTINQIQALSNAGITIEHNEEDEEDVESLSSSDESDVWSRVQETGNPGEQEIVSAQTEERGSNHEQPGKLSISVEVSALDISEDSDNEDGKQEVKDGDGSTSHALPRPNSSVHLWRRKLDTSILPGETETDSVPVKPSDRRQNGLKRKRDSTDSEKLESDGEKTPVLFDGRKEGNSIIVFDSESEHEAEDVYSNPLVSAEDALAEECIRGDRIGSTTYSERHVLKILMNWMQELPKYSIVNKMSSSKHSEEDETEPHKLKKDFRRDMTLLWDMSSEPDIMNYLVEKDIFLLVRDSILASTCDRLMEITLGILANVLSSTEILSTFHQVDEELNLVEEVVTVGCNSTHVPTLIQTFAVLRRVVWYIRNVNPVEPWLTKSFTSSEFITVVTFLLRGSTNVLLIKDLVVMLFSLLETLIPGDNEEGEKSFHLEFKYKMFTTDSIVTALCEGLNELLKPPEGDEGMAELIDDIQIPHHIQMALRCGLGSLCYLQKVSEGQEAIRHEKMVVTRFLSEFFKNFHLFTESIENENALEYFVAGVNLLAFCHMEFEDFQPHAVNYPLAAAKKFIEHEEQSHGLEPCREDAKYTSHAPEIVTSICILMHEHLGELGERFEEEVIRKAAETAVTSSFLLFISRVTDAFRENQQNDTSSEVILETGPH